MYNKRFFWSTGRASTIDISDGSQKISFSPSLFFFLLIISFLFVHFIYTCQAYMLLTASFESRTRLLCCCFLFFFWSIALTRKTFYKGKPRTIIKKKSCMCVTKDSLKLQVLNRPIEFKVLWRNFMFGLKEGTNPLLPVIYQDPHLCLFVFFIGNGHSNIWRGSRGYSIATIVCNLMPNPIPTYKFNIKFISTFWRYTHLNDPTVQFLTIQFSIINEVKWLHV